MNNEQIKQWYDEEMEDVRKYMHAACYEHGEAAQKMHEIAEQELRHAAILQSMM